MSINPIVLDILKKRGVSGQAETNEFLSDKPKLTYDPFLLPNMKDGVDFVLSAIKNNEKICIYGDYDVDGITATALLYNFLKELTDHVTYYIPSRFEDGYGLNNESLTQLKEEGVDTVITVDCGSVSKKEVEHAKDIGLKVMVTDHHDMDENNVPECIIINPKHFDSEYPFRGLCGCAVAFKLVQAMVRTEKLDRDNLVKPLDLVAVATVADVVSLTDENRTMVKYGLKELNRGTRKAFRIMTNKLNIEPGSIDSYKIGFIIGPHMNAAGRMSDANAVVRMLTTEDNGEINSIVDSLIEHNRERRSIQEKCFDECTNMIEDKYIDSPFLMVKPPSIHEGIAGIVAGKIKELYNKPAIVLSESRDEKGNILLKGSGRSIQKIDLIKMLRAHEELFEKLGGHSMAAGFTLSSENEDALRQFLIKDMEGEIKRDPDLFIKKITPDCKALKNDIDMDLAADLMLLAPFGIDNPKPVIELDDVEIKNIKYMGNENQHVKFSSGQFDCILFGSAQDNRHLLTEGKKVTLYGNPDINIWNGKESIQFLIKAITSREG